MNALGLPASRSRSELYVKVPSRSGVADDTETSSRTSAVSRSRCLLFQLYHEIVLSTLAVLLRSASSSDALPPKEKVLSPDVPSSSAETTLTRPSGSVRYGLDSLALPASVTIVSIRMSRAYAECLACTAPFDRDRTPLCAGTSGEKPPPDAGDVRPAPPNNVSV